MTANRSGIPGGGTTSYSQIKMAEDTGLANNASAGAREREFYKHVSLKASDLGSKHDGLTGDNVDTTSPSDRQ